MLISGRVGNAPSTPPAPVLIFDGACGFCRRWVGRAKRLDRADRVRLLPLADPEAPRLSGQPPELLRQATHLVRPDGAVFAGAAAVRELARYLRWGWAIRVLLRVPGALAVAERIYGWIARRWGPVG